MPGPAVLSARRHRADRHRLPTSCSATSIPRTSSAVRCRSASVTPVVRMQRRVADPLGIDVDEAAQRVRRLIDGLMGQEIYRQTALKGYDPRDFTMFAFGGAGPVHACDVAEHADVGSIMTFPQGSEFNAFGVGTMAVLQTYERTRMVELFDGDDFTDDLETFNDRGPEPDRTGGARSRRGGLRGSRRRASIHAAARARHAVRRPAPHSAPGVTPPAADRS